MPLRFTQHDNLGTIQAWTDRRILGTFERSARSLRLRNRAWHISFDAGGPFQTLLGISNRKAPLPLRNLVVLSKP